MEEQQNEQQILGERTIIDDETRIQQNIDEFYDFMKEFENNPEKIRKLNL